MHKNLFLFPFCLLCTVPGFAQEATSTQKPLQTITLQDGSTIKGHLKSITGDQYTIENETMGQVHVPAGQVTNISAGQAANTNNPSLPNLSSGTGTAMPQLNPAQASLMQDPEIMAMMQEMLKDPSITELFKDPSIMQDALTMDPEKIKNNPQIQKLMQNPQMQAIIQRTAQKYQAQAPQATKPTSFPTQNH